MNQDKVVELAVSCKSAIDRCKELEEENKKLLQIIINFESLPIAQDNIELKKENKKLKECVELMADLRNAPDLTLSEFSSQESLQNLFDYVIKKSKYTLKELEK